jgi:hypothetical protein
MLLPPPRFQTLTEVRVVKLGMGCPFPGTLRVAASRPPSRCGRRVRRSRIAAPMIDAQAPNAATAAAIAETTAAWLALGQLTAAWCVARSPEGLEGGRSRAALARAEVSVPIERGRNRGVPHECPVAPSRRESHRGVRVRVSPRALPVWSTPADSSEKHGRPVDSPACLDSAWVQLSRSLESSCSQRGCTSGIRS